MPLLARLTAVPSGDEARASGRRTLRLEVSVSTSGDANNALIHNLSEHGLLVETAESLLEGEMIEVDLPEAGVTAAIIVWTRSGLAGCRFQRPISTAAVSASLLRSPASEPVKSVNDQPIGAVAWDYEPADDLDVDTSTRAIVIVSLILALSATTIFIVALLSFSFSLD